MLANQMKSSSYVCGLIDKKMQFSMGCQHYMRTHLMSPVLAITSGMANNRPCHMLRLHEHTYISQFYTDMGCTVKHMYSMFVSVVQIKFSGLIETYQSNTIGLQEALQR